MLNVFICATLVMQRWLYFMIWTSAIYFTVAITIFCTCQFVQYCTFLFNLLILIISI